MNHPRARGKRGFTLLEALTTTSILTTLTMLAVPVIQDLLISQQLRANANQVQSMVFTARAEGAYRSNMLICSGKGRCESFDEPDNRLILVADKNANAILDQSDKVIEELSLPQGMTIQWRSFRNLPSLQINRFGVAYYQNGHFLLCYRGHARKVILNFQAKARVTTEATTKHCPPLS